MRKFLLMVFGLMATPAVAGTTTGKVGEIIVRASDNLHYVEILGTPTGRPACAVTTTYYIIKDENSRAGQTQMALLMSARLGGLTVRLDGTGSCTRWIDGEDINLVILQP